MISAAIATVAFGAASAALGGFLWRLLRLPVRRGESALSAIALGVGVITLALFVAGLFGALYGTVVWAVFVTPVVIFNGRLRGAASEILGVAKRAFRAAGFYNRILLFVILSVLALDLVSSLAPPTESDAMTLHILVPREYARAHRMIDLPDNWDSAMAMGPHLAYAAVMLASGGDLAPAVLHFALGCLFILWVWQFVRRRFGKSAAYAAAAVIAPMPMVTHLIIAPMVDMFFALYSIAALVWVLEFMRGRSGVALGLAAVFTGFSATAKYAGIVLIASVFAIAAVWIVTSTDQRLRLVRAAAAAAFAAALIVSPFYIRNYLWTGNPVFPTMKGVFGGPGWDTPRWDTVVPETPRDAKLRHTLGNMLLAPWYVTNDSSDVSSGESELVGPAFLVFLPLVLFMRTRRRLILHLALYCLVAYALIYWTGPRPRSRYFLPLAPVLGAFVGAGLLLLRKYSGPAFQAGRLVVLVTAASGLAAAMIYSVSFIKVVFHMTPRDTFLTRSTDFYDECVWMDRNLPPNARMLVQATNNLYYVPRPSMRLEASSDYTHCDSTPLFGLDAAGTPPGALERMKVFGITHIFADAGFVSERNASPCGRILGQLEAAGYIGKIREAMGARGTRNPITKQKQESVALYEIRYDAGGGQ